MISQILFVLGVFIEVIHLGQTLECYKCNSTTAYGHEGCTDYPHYYSIIREICPINVPHVCTVYKYDVTLYDITSTTTTIRGCQPLTMVRDCRQLFREAQRIVYPAKVQEKLCYSCAYDLCNVGNTYISSRKFPVIAVLFTVYVNYNL